jgi:hypothetical protein
MSWLIVGTVPYQDFPLLDAGCSTSHGRILLGNESVPIARGTPALLAAACIAAEVLGIDGPRTLLAGDVGHGDGSRKIYEHLVQTMLDRGESLMVFHYLQPDVDWHNRILLKIEDRPDSPLLIADAGYMYVAKMSGFAASYDLFTPDVGELAFLADESAPHPFYTRGFLLKEEAQIPELIRRAYEHENAARYLLVKGGHDFVVSANGVIAEISEPCVENMEPVGGTGDSLTGIVAALLASEKAVPEAAKLGAMINRLMGLRSDPTPAFPIEELLRFLPTALEDVQNGPKLQQ